jgi:hypothetical protein
MDVDKGSVGDHNENGPGKDPGGMALPPPFSPMAPSTAQSCSMGLGEADCIQDTESKILDDSGLLRLPPTLKMENLPAAQQDVPGRKLSQRLGNMRSVLMLVTSARPCLFFHFVFEIVL